MKSSTFQSFLRRGKFGLIEKPHVRQKINDEADDRVEVGRGIATTVYLSSNLRKG